MGKASTKTKQVLLIPSIGELVSASTDLAEKLASLRKRHFPKDDSSDPEHLPIRYPLRVRWQIPFVNGEWVKSEDSDEYKLEKRKITPMVREIMSWGKALRTYIQSLDTYFLDVRDMPKRHARYYFRSLDRASSPYENVSIDECLYLLGEDRKRLLLFAVKEKVLVPETLPALLKKKRAELRMSQAQAARRISVNLPTYKNWEAGRVFPGRSNLVRAEKFLSLTRKKTALKKSVPETAKSLTRR